MDHSNKEQQIETAQQIVDLISQDREQFKDKKVVDVEATENVNEVIVRFNDWTTTKVTGLFAKKILAGRVVNL